MNKHKNKNFKLIALCLMIALITVCFATMLVACDLTGNGGNDSSNIGGDNIDTNTPSKPGDNTGTDTPSTPGDNTGTDKPSNPGGNTGTDKPSNPGGNTGTNNPSNPGDNTGTDKPSNPGKPSTKPTAFEQQIFTALEKLMGYAAATYSDDVLIEDVTIYFGFRNNYITDDGNSIPYAVLELYQYLDNYHNQCEYPIRVYIYNDEVSAIQAYDSFKSDEAFNSDNIYRDGALIIIEKEDGIYKAAQPPVLCNASQKALSFIKNSISTELKSDNYKYFEADLCLENSQTIYGYAGSTTPLHGNRFTFYMYQSTLNAVADDVEYLHKSISAFTDDSYVNVNDDVYIFCKDRLGLQFVLNDDEQSYNVYGFRYDEEKSLNIDIPSIYNNLPVTGISSLFSNFMCGCLNYNDAGEKLTSITIPASVTTIDRDVFEYCNNLTTATLPAFALAYIPKENLQTLVINSGSLASGALNDCTKLSSLTISKNVTTIQKDAIKNCPQLSEIVFDGTLDEWELVDKSPSWIDRSTITVRCKNGVKTEEVGISTGEVFEKIWASAYNKFGSTSFGYYDDIVFNFDIELALNARKANANSDLVQQSLIGIEFKAVYDRHTETSENSAFKLRFYNPSDNNKTLLSLYFFADDWDNAYIEFDGTSIKVPHGFYSFVLVEIFGDVFVPDFKNFLQTLGTLKWYVTVYDAIESTIGEFGNGWSLNKPINHILDMLGVDVKATIESNEGIGNLINQILGINYNELFDSYGNLDMLRFLQIPAMQMLFTADKSMNGNSTTYTLTLNDAVLTMWAGLFDIAKNLFSTETNANNEISLTLTESYNTINSLSLLARFAGLQTQMKDANGINIQVVPEIVLTVKDFNVQRYNGSNGIRANKQNFTDAVAIEDKTTIDISGITLGTIEGLGNDPIVLDGKLEITFVGKFDLVNVYDNKTNINLLVDHTDKTGFKRRIATASFTGSTLAISLANEITVNGQIIKGFVYDTGMNLAQMFRQYIRNIIAPPADSPAVSAATFDENNSSDIVREIALQIVAVGKTLLSSLRPSDNLTFATDDILGWYVLLRKNLNPNYTMSRPQLQNVLINELREAISRLQNLSYQDCVNILKNNQSIIDDEGKEYFTGDALNKLYFLFVQALRFNGVNISLSENACVTNFTAIIGAAISASADMKDGLHLHFDIGIANATISIDRNINIVNDYYISFVDVSQDYYNASEDEKAKWLDLSEFSNSDDQSVTV